MIAKFKKRVDFSGIVNYANNHKSDTKRARIIEYQGVCVVSNQTIADSFNTHMRKPDSNGKVHHISHPVKHISISFSPKDAALFPDNEDGDRFMAQLVNEWLNGMGIRNAQFIVARHFDKPHPHCHLVYSRIDLDGNVVSSFNELKRNIKVCKDIKLRHGLTFGDSTGLDIKRDRLRPADKLRLDMKAAVIRAVESSSSWQQFQSCLEADGIEACFTINRSTGAIRGISFAKDGVRFAGSKLSKDKLTYGKLAAKFGALHTHDKPLISSQSGETIHNDSTKTPSVEESGTIPTPADSADEEDSNIQLISLATIIDILMAPTVVPTSGVGGTTNDLDWNDECRRQKEAEENRHIHQPFKRRR